MNDNLRTIAAKVRALMAKTVENGASEAEALAASAKAREMIDKYQLIMTDVELEAEGVGRGDSDAHTAAGTSINKALGLKTTLALRIAEYCDCRVWVDRSAGAIVFFGLTSDRDFALWLLDSLALFTVQRTDHYMKHECHLVSIQARWPARRSFALGCAARINSRLGEMTRARQAQSAAASTGRDLVVVKSAIVDREFAALDMKLRSGRSRTTKLHDTSAFHAGVTAGEGASFGRPLNGNGAVARIGNH